MDELEKIKNDYLKAGDAQAKAGRILTDKMHKYLTAQQEHENAEKEYFNVVNNRMKCGLILNRKIAEDIVKKLNKQEKN